MAQFFFHHLDQRKKVEKLQKLCSEKAQVLSECRTFFALGIQNQNVCQNKLDSVWEVDKLREALRKDWTNLVVP